MSTFNQLLLKRSTSLSLIKISCRHYNNFNRISGITAINKKPAVFSKKSNNIGNVINQELYWKNLIATASTLNTTTNTIKTNTIMSNQPAVIFQQNNNNYRYDNDDDPMNVEINDSNNKRENFIVVEQQSTSTSSFNNQYSSMEGISSSNTESLTSTGRIIAATSAAPVTPDVSVEVDRAYVNGVNAINTYSNSGSFSSFLFNSVNNKNNNNSKLQKFKNHNRKMSSYSCHNPVVQVDNINPNIVVMEYAVRGPLVIRAGEIEKELKAGQKKPFNEVIRANIGDCHAMGQKPITFLRQVMGVTIQPHLLESPDYPSDIKERAKTVLNGCHGFSLGSYSDSAGIEVIRRQAADYIQNRDGHPSDWTNIILTAGASQGIKGLLSLLRCKVDGKKPGVMVPIPQYPLYSATIAEFGMQQIGYYLDESNNWGLNISELERAVNESRKNSCPRALVVINPGNPTGQVLTLENIQEIIKFAHREKLVLFADEVYQDNIYDKSSKFHSFKRVLMDMGEPYNKMELASFMSCSKGYMGECGIRGGYMEIINFDPSVKAMFLKSISAQLCPTTIGQVAISCVVNPPKPGEPSYEKFIKEKTEVLSALKERAELVYKTFNSFEGFSCNPVQGAMYAFPQIKIPPKAIEAAKKAGKAPDVFYAFELLETSGICIVPGTGFGQQPGTHHFRTTILPQTDKLKIMLQKFQKFHNDFMAKYK